MPVTVRDKQYVVTPALVAGELPPSAAEPKLALGPTSGDIPAETRRALGSWLSDVTKGKSSVGVASVRPVTDDLFEETSLKSQPHNARGQARYALPSSVSSFAPEPQTELLLRAPASVEAFVSAVSANSSSVESPISATGVLVRGQRRSRAEMSGVGGSLTSEVAATSAPITAEKLFAVRRAASGFDAVAGLRAVAADVSALSVTQTHGQLTSPADPISGLSAAAITAAASAIVVAVAAAAVAALAATPKQRSPSGALQLGHSSLSRGALAGVFTTKRDFKLCVIAGLSAFFGVTSLSVPSAVTVAATLSGGDAAFKLSLARSLVRLSAVTSPAGALAVLRAASVFGALGDALLSAIEAPVPQRLDWVKPSSAAPSLYSYPPNLARDALDAPWLAAPREKRAVVKSVASRGKLSTADRESFERALDAEYVPFYFHDLRTNEIISFHAFLSELSDAYSPQWESSDGYGRVDAVHTYKSTGRALSLAFIVVATSADDFTDMWVKLNKLVTLVYPQFDGGRWVKSDQSGTDAFTQPFSQAFSASPIVRLRVGDVIGSNATPLAIRRLFGYGEDGLTLSGKRVSYEASADPDTLASLVKSAAVQPGTGYTFFLAPGAYESVGKTSNARAFDTSTLLSQTSLVATVVSVVGDDSVAVALRANSTDKSAGAAADVRAATVAGALTGAVVTSPRALRATPETLKKIEQKLTPDAERSSAGGSAEVLGFFSEQSNAVVRSFRESGGRGIAGKIDSLTLNLLDKTVWETEPGRRGPTCVQVSLGFTVIHDIAPGLDKSGSPRAALYPIRRS